jgi:hypothetical protein
LTCALRSIIDAWNFSHGVPSLALVASGVGHNSWRLPPELLLAGAGGPCISATIAPTSLSLRLRCVPSGFTASSEQPVVSFQSRAFAVGHDKHPLSLVRRTNLARTEYSPRRFVTQFFQITEHAGESQRDVPFDVFEEHGLGSQNSNAVCDGWPEVAGIVGAESFSCRRERLAGITSREEVHSARKRSPREGFEIAPDWSRVKVPRFHAR